MVSKRVMNLVFVIAVFVMAEAVNAAIVANFEDITLPPESYWNGSDGSGGFTSGSAFFNNNFTDLGGGVTSWDGFAYSNITDTQTVGMDGQYNAIAGGGQGCSPNYAVGYIGYGEPPTITLGTARIVDGLYVTNDNYAYYSMLNGDAFAKRFGGVSGNDEDWFVLTITGKDTGGVSTGAVDFYLADYRFADDGQDYIVKTWEFIGLTSLGMVRSLEFSLSSSDVGQWGMNTPAYFVIDTIVPEPATIMLLGLGGLFLARRNRQ